MLRPCLLSVLLALLPGVAAPAPTLTATEAYLAYLAAARQARSLEELLPHLSQGFRAMLSARPREQHAEWLENLRDSVQLEGLRIHRESCKGATCTLEGSARSRRGLPLKGKVSMRLEAGGWKLAEEAWATTGESAP